MAAYRITQYASFSSTIEIDIDANEAESEHDVWEMANAEEFKYLFEDASDDSSDYRYEVEKQ